MNALEQVVPDDFERRHLVQTLVELGFTAVELALASDRAEVYLFVPASELARVGADVAHREVARAMPGRKTTVTVKPREVPTVEIELTPRGGSNA